MQVISASLVQQFCMKNCTTGSAAWMIVWDVTPCQLNVAIPNLPMMPFLSITLHSIAKQVLIRLKDVHECGQAAEQQTAAQPEHASPARRQGGSAGPHDPAQKQPPSQVPETPGADLPDGSLPAKRRRLMQERQPAMLEDAAAPSDASAPGNSAAGVFGLTTPSERRKDMARVVDTYPLMDIRRHHGSHCRCPVGTTWQRPQVAHSPCSFHMTAVDACAWSRLEPIRGLTPCTSSSGPFQCCYF